MLSSQGFDLWANDYDQSVHEADTNNEYPFAGYKRLMNAVYATVLQNGPKAVLDVGIGTAFLSKKLYDAGCRVTGLDFSADMLAKAQSKMPDARLLQWDFTQGIPPQLAGERFDFIISTYALHHLSYEAQSMFIHALCEHLEPEGRILIGDVSFATQEALDNCRAASGDAWDDEENYIVFSKLRETLHGCRAVFHPFSFCAGVVEVEIKQA